MADLEQSKALKLSEAILCTIVARRHDETSQSITDEILRVVASFRATDRIGLRTMIIGILCDYQDGDVMSHYADRIMEILPLDEGF